MTETPAAQLSVSVDDHVKDKEGENGGTEPTRKIHQLERGNRQIIMSAVQVYSASNSVGSSSSDSSRGTCRKTRFRTVHLKRAVGTSTFGFSFRGGREFGTGFFVSVVEPGSEAHQKGVKVGDQILRINGLSVENATHHEILQLAQHHHHLTLSLKNVGLIPVKDHMDDPLTWRLVEQPLDPSLLTGSSDIDRIVIDAPEGSKLGCGICKGPDWRPGIFVQYTKPGSLARQCGLQPGDQILQCNRVSFTDIDFAYAVQVLKGQGTLDLVLRKGSGIDLFPGESSGYSSASSTTDETSTHSIKKPGEGGKRINHVIEDERYSIPSRRPGEKRAAPVPVPPPCVPRPPPLKSSSSVDNILDELKTAGNQGNQISNAPPPPLLTFRQECRYGTQTVVQISGGHNGPMQVEVHQASPPALPKLEKSSSISSFSSGASLSSAISQELQKRKERKMNGEGDVMRELPPKKPLDGQNREHDLLIAELKRRQDNRIALSNQQALAQQSNLSDSPPPSPDSLDSPPPCPTPDYSDTSARQSPQPSRTVKSSILRFEERTKKVHAPKSVTFGVTSTKEITPQKRDNSCEKSVEVVEMHSIDNHELLQPKKQAPKPPDTYFKPPNRKDLTESPKRTTVIKITEYPSENNNKSPGKFDFLEDKEKKGGESFDSELAKTLSRVQLKSRPDVVSPLKTVERSPVSVNVNGLKQPQVNPQFVPVQNISQDELSTVKKTLKTFEKKSGSNTIIVQIPKRN